MAASTGETSLVDVVRSFEARIVGMRDQIEAERRLPDDLARDLARAGLFRIARPAPYGGLDRTPMEGLEVFEALAQADASVAWCVWNGNAYWTVTQLSGAVADEIFADPNVIVANSTQPKGRADIVQGGYRVSGRWSLVSGCQISDWMQLLCIVHRDGKPRLTPSGLPQARFIYCRAAECEIVDTWKASGLRGTGSHDVVVQDLFVPKRHGSFYTDRPVLTDARYRLPSWTREIPGCGAIALGIARGAIEALIELGGAKRPERSSQLLSEDRGAQVRLAQAEALVSSARLLLFDAVSRLWDDILAVGEVSLDGRARVRLATSHAVASAVQAVDLAQLTGGASSVYSGSPLERAFRDVHAITQHIAVHPRVMETIGRVLFGLDVDAPIF